MTRDLIDRAVLLEFMDRVHRHMEADMLAAGNGAYVRGYAAAIKDIHMAPRIAFQTDEAAQ